MKLENILPTVGLALAVVFPLLASDQAASPTSAPTTNTSAIEPSATEALDKMGAYLRTLKVFQIQADTTTEDVLQDGQKLQFTSSADLLVQGADHLKVAVTSDRHERIYYYDGKTFTLWGPRVNYYATVPAPSTIGELADMLAEKFDIELPLVDLFRWGGPKSRENSITAAMEVGPALVGGASCTQYAFRQPGLDWQIWIQNGDHRLPRKLVLTTMSDEARPQATLTYTWNLAPAFNEAAFIFRPPPGASKIPLAGTQATETTK